MYSNLRFFNGFFLLGIVLCAYFSTEAATILGEKKKWHKLTFLFDGPNTGEGATTNPFTDYRLVVTFTNGGTTYEVPGHYAADGNAAETSDTSGNKWRVYFVPDQTGIWNYSVSFRTGSYIAIDLSPGAGSAVSPLDGETGSFTVTATDKNGSDWRGKGMLRYVGEHYLQFAETGEYFIKGGADSPENFLAYYEFDQTSDLGGTSTPGLVNGLHQYGPHVAHWNSGDPTWQVGKGKGIIGALNYLASKGINSVYFLTYNIDGGDGRDVWMWTDPNERERFDISKLDQWEIVFSHMDQLGIQLHVITQETENDQKLGGNGTLNDIRKLYYRELVSRFSHHLGVQWNIGEENTNSDAQRADFAQYIRTLDPYDHPINVHTKNNTALTFYNGILNNSSYLRYFEATSIQGHSSNYNDWAISLRSTSESKGKKWAIYGDEQGPAVNPTSNNDGLRRDALWGNLMGGGAGVEWYFGYQNTFGDVQSEDWTVVASLWEDTKHALDFFHLYLPFDEMEPDNALLSAGASDYCFVKEGEVYAGYLRYGNGGAAVDLNISTSGNYIVKWYNPRTGGSLQDGSVTSVTGGGTTNIGTNPDTTSDDWAFLVIVEDSLHCQWLGDVSDDWFDADNWSCSAVPDQTQDVVIPDVAPNPFPVIQGAFGQTAEVLDLTIEAGAQLTVDEVNDVELVIHGDLSNDGAIMGNGIIAFNGGTHDLLSPVSFGGTVAVKSGATLNTNGNLTLQSGASLLHGAGTPGGEGSVNGTVTIQRIGYSASNHWNYWASPVSGEDVSVLGNNLHYYDVNSALDPVSVSGLQAGWKSASGSMAVGVGYISQGGGTVSFTGTVDHLNNGTAISVPITRKAATNVGYNFVGNPFPSAMSADSFMAVNGPDTSFGGNNTITGALYFWDDDGTGGSGYSTADFAVWSGAGSVNGPNHSSIVFDGHIASGQGFFVEKVDDGPGTIAFTNNMRSTKNDVFFKRQPVERCWISVENQAGLYNETLIAFLDKATEGVDLAYDAKKLKGNAKIALYTKIDSADYAIQALPKLTGDRVEALGLEAGVSGTYTLKLKAIEHLDESQVVILEDRMTGTFQNLRKTPEYTFYMQAGNIENRFFFHFRPALVIDIIEEGCDGMDGRLELYQAGSQIWNYILSDESGHLVESGSGLNGQAVFDGLAGGNYKLALSDTFGYQIVKDIDVGSVEEVTADFEVEGDLNEGESILFVNQSTGANRYDWDFGDGTVLSGIEHPLHAYQEEGVYEVTLIASNDDCYDEWIQEVQVRRKATGMMVNSYSELVDIYGYGNTIYLNLFLYGENTAVLRIYDLLGNTIEEKDLPVKGKFQIHFPGQNSGYYLVKLTTRDKVYSAKILLTPY